MPKQLDSSKVGAEGVRLPDLINSSVWQRVSRLMGGLSGEMPTPDLIGKYSQMGDRFGSVERPTFDMGNGAQGMLTGNGGMAWGYIDPAWQGLKQKPAPPPPVETMQEPTGDEMQPLNSGPELDENGLPLTMPQWKRDMVAERKRGNYGYQDPLGREFF